jgi:hypothetical protein
VIDEWKDMFENFPAHIKGIYGLAIVLRRKGAVTPTRITRLAVVAFRLTVIVAANVYTVAAYARSPGMFEGFAPDGCTRIQADGSFIRTTTGGRIDLKIRIGTTVTYDVHDIYGEIKGEVSVSVHGSTMTIDEVWTDIPIDHGLRATKGTKEIFTLLSRSSCVWEEVALGKTVSLTQCAPYMTSGLIYRH